jgi:hypothetical protein
MGKAGAIFSMAFWAEHLRKSLHQHSISGKVPLNGIPGRVDFRMDFSGFPADQAL